MHRPRDCHTEWSKSDTERQITWYFLYVDSKEKRYKWTYLQNRSRGTDVENKLMVTKGWWGGIHWKIGTDIYILLYIKYITNKDLLYSTGNSTQYSAVTHMGKESKKIRVDTCICITDSLRCIPETNRNWRYRAFLFLAAKNRINLISVLTIWWCPCAESSLLLFKKSVCYDQCILLAKFC